MSYTEKDLADAFREGWKARNRSPGLKRKARRSVHNMLAPPHLHQFDLVPDVRAYHHSHWLNSEYRKALRSTEGADDQP